MGWRELRPRVLASLPRAAYLVTSYDAKAEIADEADGRTECARQGPPADARREAGPTPADLTAGDLTPGDAKDDLRNAVHHDLSVPAPCDNRNREPSPAADASRSRAQSHEHRLLLPATRAKTRCRWLPHARCVRRGGCSRRAPRERRS